LVETSSTNAAAGRNCLNCGFLCRRDTVNPHLSEYREITQEDRASARFIRHERMDGPLFVWCYRSIPIADEICSRSGFDQHPLPDAPDRPAKQNAAALEVFAAHEGCSRWFEYLPGLDPKEHLAELRLHEFHEALAQQRRDSDRALAASNTASNWRIAIASMVVAAILAGAQIWIASHPPVTQPDRGYPTPSVSSAPPTQTDQSK